jgi:hypothetical protein
MARCAIFFTGMLQQDVEMWDVSKWWVKYKENQGPEPTDTGSPDELLLKIIRINPEAECRMMKVWAEFISMWSHTLLTPNDVFGRWLEYWSPQDPVAGEDVPGPEDFTIASNGRDSDYGTRPPPPSGFESRDATQPRGPER